MLFTTHWLQTIFQETNDYTKEERNIDKVNTDSRQQERQSLFVPIVGEQFDGHAYLLQAIEGGAIATLWQHNRALPDDLPTDFLVFFVEDTTTALQQLAHAYRQKINPTVIGITGSNGKTTTKDLVTSVVGTVYKTHATIGNFNNHIGLPLTILDMPAQTEMLVLEMGMSNFKEIELLSDIARPNYAIITNIGESHIEYLGTRAGIAEAKLEITYGMNPSGTLIVDGDESLLQSITKPDKVIKCGLGEENDVIIHDISLKEQYTQFRVDLDKSDYCIPLLGKHHAKNATFAITIGKALDISIENIKQGLTDLNITSMRFEILQGQNDVAIINDAYNASPTSMKASIDVVKQMTGYQKRILILGDVFELGEQSEQLHASVADVITHPITNVYTYGQDAKCITDHVRMQQPAIVCQHFKNQTSLIQTIKTFLDPDTLILFKASRGMQFETLVKSIL